MKIFIFLFFVQTIFSASDGDCVSASSEACTSIDLSSIEEFCCTKLDIDTSVKMCTAYTFDNFEYFSNPIFNAIERENLGESCFN